MSSRLYRITWKFRITGTAANDLAAVYLTDASNGQADRSLHEIPALLPAYASVMSIGMHYATGLSGTITRKLRMERNIGSGSLSARRPEPRSGSWSSRTWAQPDGRAALLRAPRGGRSRRRKRKATSCRCR